MDACSSLKARRLKSVNPPPDYASTGLRTGSDCLQILAREGKNANRKPRLERGFPVLQVLAAPLAGGTA
jgi:hypothetical protein